ncbi:MAG: hypothetical protein ACPF9D_01345 [Owenweeksia sp.]
MGRKLAQWLSYLIHPVVYPILGTLVILEALPYYVSSRLTILSLALVFTGTYIIPVSISFLFYRIQLISSLEMKEARDRRWPYLIGSICYYLTASFLGELGLPEDVYLFLLASAFVIVLHLVMLRFSKPSAHLAGIGGFTGLLLSTSFKYQVGFLPLLALCFLLAGFLGSARLKLNAHSPGELATGYFTGLVIVCLTVLLG